jgi:hypothetical protein
VAFEDLEDAPLMLEGIVGWAYPLVIHVHLSLASLAAHEVHYLLERLTVAEIIEAADREASYKARPGIRQNVTAV